MARNKKHLTAALLSSALFALSVSTSSYAIVNLDANADNKDNTLGYAAGTGYNFTAPDVTFRVLDAVNPGADGGVSIANNQSSPGSPLANTVFQFVGDSTVIGNVGSATNPIGQIQVNTGFGTNKTVSFTGGTLIAADSLIIFGDGTTNPGNGSSIVLSGGLRTVSAPIQTSTHNMNQITLSSATIFTDQIGTADKNLYLIQINNSPVTFQDKVYAGEVNINTGTLNITNGEVFAPITTAGDLTSNVNFNTSAIVHQDIGTFAKRLVNIVINDGVVVDLNASVHLGNAGGLEVQPGGLVNYNTSTFHSGLASIGGSVFIAHNQFVGHDTILFGGPNSVARFDMNNDLTFVGTYSGSTSLTLNGASIEVINPGFSPGVTSSFDIMQDKSLAGLANIGSVTTTGFLTSVSASAFGDFLRLHVISIPSANFANTPQTFGVASALDQLALQLLTSDNVDPLRNILTQMNKFPDSAAMNQALSTLAPIVDGALLFEGINMQQTFFGEIGDRMSSVDFFKRHIKNASGVSSGDWHWTQESTWMKLVGQTAKQKERNQVAGYDNDMMGIILGGDFNVDNNLTVGGALGWLTSRVNDRVWDGTKTDIHSIQGSLYAGYDCDGPWFFNNLIGFAYNDYNQYREIQFGTAHLSASSDFDGWQIAGKSEVGYFISSPQFKDAYVVPNASIYYTHIIMSGYDEKGAGTASQSVNRENYDALIASIGFKAMRDFVDQVTLIQPEVHLNVYYDFVGDRFETSSQFTGLGPTFKTVGYNPARLGVNVGAALSIYTQKGFTFTAEYDFDAKADYTANAGMLRGRYIWG